MIHLQEKINFSGYTLIFPSVSVGNVGQLAVDLLIMKLKPKKVGMLWHSAIMPMVGGNPYNFKDLDLTTSAEVYYSEQRKLIIFQIRSPIMRGTSKDFINSLVDWIKKNGITKIIILTGVFDYTRHDSEIEAPSLKIITSPSLSKEFKIFKKVKDEETSNQTLVSVLSWDGTENSVRMHGGGIVKNLLRECIAKDIPAAVVMKYCSEGDNVPDSQLVCNCLNQFLKLAPSGCTWEAPPSWINMFGNLPQLALY